MFKATGITEKERMLLQLISRGLSSRQISELLYVNLYTAETYRRQLFKKFAARTTAELMEKAGKSAALE